MFLSKMHFSPDAIEGSGGSAPTNAADGGASKNTDNEGFDNFFGFDVPKSKLTGEALKNYENLKKLVENNNKAKQDAGKNSGKAQDDKADKSDKSDKVDITDDDFEKFKKTALFQKAYNEANGKLAKEAGLEKITPELIKKLLKDSEEYKKFRDRDKTEEQLAIENLQSQLEEVNTGKEAAEKKAQLLLQFFVKNGVRESLERAAIQHSHRPDRVAQIFKDELDVDVDLLFTRLGKGDFTIPIISKNTNTPINLDDYIAEKKKDPSNADLFSSFNSKSGSGGRNQGSPFGAGLDKSDRQKLQSIKETLKAAQK